MLKNAAEVQVAWGTGKEVEVRLKERSPGIPGNWFEVGRNHGLYMQANFDGWEWRIKPTIEVLYTRLDKDHAGCLVANNASDWPNLRVVFEDGVLIAAKPIPMADSRRPFADETSLFQRCVTSVEVPDYIIEVPDKAMILRMKDIPVNLLPWLLANERLRFRAKILSLKDFRLTDAPNKDLPIPARFLETYFRI